MPNSFKQMMAIMKKMEKRGEKNRKQALKYKNPVPWDQILAPNLNSGTLHF